MVVVHGRNVGNPKHCCASKTENCTAQPGFRVALQGSNGQEQKVGETLSFVWKLLVLKL